MKILFINLSALKFNVATPDTEPLGGSESCVCYLARELAIQGHNVMLLARLPEGGPETLLGVRHGPLALTKDTAFFEAGEFDVIIACNAPMICPYLKAVSPLSRIILWDHVPPEQPSMQELSNPEVLKSIDVIAYVSQWQKDETESRFRFRKASAIIGNGLTPSFAHMFASADELLRTKENRAAYTTIPYRGLPLLARVMEETTTDIKLDVFSSMRVYQMGDEEYAPLFASMAKNPKITSHGSVSQKELAQHLRRAAFLIYPCVCAETFCIAALEAMAAGMKVLTTRQGALETTTMGFADLIAIDPDNVGGLIHDFTELLDRNVKNFLSAPQAWAAQMFDQVRTVNRECSWALRSRAWEKMLASPQE